MWDVWLDLEQTIIDSYESGKLINVRKIKRFLDELEMGNLNIWSFVVYNEDDREGFVGGLCGILEEVLGRQIIEVPTIIEIRDKVFCYEGIRYDSVMDFMQLNGKHWSFMKYCLGNRVGKKSLLIDDVVPNLSIMDEHGTYIRLVNVDSI
jgi:hypothetical protein